MAYTLGLAVGFDWKGIVRPDTKIVFSTPGIGTNLFRHRADEFDSEFARKVEPIGSKGYLGPNLQRDGVR